MKNTFFKEIHLSGPSSYLSKFLPNLIYLENENVDKDDLVHIG